MRVIRRPVIRAIGTHLRDGTPIRIRPVRPDDSRHAAAFFDWLSEETKYTRFMYQVKELTPEILAGAMTQEGLKRVVLVAEPVGQSSENPTPAVAIGRYAPAADAGACEVALTVGDAWQGRGVGGALLARLIVLARRGGYQQMCATALTTNAKMLGLAHAFGFEVHADGAGVTSMKKVLIRTPRPR